MHALSADESLRWRRGARRGGKAFAAGADIASSRRACELSGRRRLWRPHLTTAMQAVAGCRHPTLALIEGACIGGGLEIAACGDMRICGASSRFGVPITPRPHDGLRRAARAAGARRAPSRSRSCCEGRVFGADEAWPSACEPRRSGRGGRTCGLRDRRAHRGRRAAGSLRWHSQYIDRLTPGVVSRRRNGTRLRVFDTEDYARVGGVPRQAEADFKGR